MPVLHVCNEPMLHDEHRCSCGAALSLAGHQSFAPTSFPTTALHDASAARRLDAWIAQFEAQQARPPLTPWCALCGATATRLDALRGVPLCDGCASGAPL